MKLSLLAVAAISLAAVLAGCSGSVQVGPMVSTQKVESAITAKINDMVPPGTPVSVSCPGDVAAKANGTFQCTATVANQPLTFAVTQTNDQGDVTFVQDSAIVQTVAVQSLLAQGLADRQGGTWAVDCAAAGSTVIVHKPTQTFVCQASGQAGTDSASGTVTATVSDIQGHVTWEFK